MKRKALLLLIPFAVAGLAGCQSASDPGTNPTGQCDQAEVTLNETSATLSVGGELELIATAPDGCGDLGWGVNEAGESVVSLEKNGTKCTVHALAAGTAIVGYGTTASCTITVVSGEVVHVTGLQIDSLYYNLKVGDPDKQIGYTILPEDASNKSVTFVSGNIDVVTVNGSGLVHVVGSGTTTIVVTSVDNPEVTKTINVTVTGADIDMPSTTIAGYNRVDSGELVDGSQVEFISQTNSKIYGMKKYDSGSNIKGVECSVSQNVIVEASDVALYTVEKNDDSTFSFVDSDGKYLCASAGSSNKLTAKATKDDFCKFSVSIENGLASIVCHAAGVERGTLCLNYNSGTPLFNCYKALGSYSQVSFYSKESGEQKDIKSIELKVADDYKKEYLDTDNWSAVGLSVEATYTDDTKGTLDPRSYNLEFDPEKPALGVTSVSVKAKLVAGSESETEPVVISGITVTHNEEIIHVTGISVADLYPKMKVGDPDKQIEVTVSPENATNKNLTYTIDTTDVATVSDSGLIHAIAPGTANITVASVDTPSITKKVQLTVTAADIVLPTVTSDSYTKVVSGELVDGAQVEFLSQTNGKVYGMKKYDSGNNIKGAECALGTDVITIDSSVEHYTVEKNDDGSFSFKDSSDNYLYAAGGTSNNHLKAKAAKDSTAKFNIVITNGLASIVCADTAVTKNTMALNYNNGTPLFSCYGSLGSYSQISFYQKVPVAPILSGISVSTSAHRSFYLNDDFIKETITATYENADPRDVTSDAVFTGYDMSQSGEQTVSVSYTENEVEKTTSYSITVAEAPAPEIKSISIDASAMKKDYTHGQAIDLTGVVVSAHYEDGDPVVLDAEKYTLVCDPVTADYATQKTTLTATLKNAPAGVNPAVLDVNLTVSEAHGIVAEGTYLINVTVEGTTYYMQENGSSAPKAVTNADDATQFIFSLVSGTNDHYHIKTATGDYLYSIADNNGIRVGKTEFVWIIEEGEPTLSGAFNLKQNSALKDGETARYLTLYNTQDFRSYNSATAGNRKANTDLEVCIVKTLDSISVTSGPTKNTYYVGESLQTEGLVVKGHYVWDGGSEDKEITGYELSQTGPFVEEDIGEKTITVSYSGKTTSFVVTVQERTATLSSVTISGTAQSEYSVGDKYNHNGLTATANYSDGGTLDVSDLAEWTISKETAEKGDTSITITAEYEGVSGTKDVDVTVTEPSTEGRTVETAIKNIGGFTETSYVGAKTVEIDKLNFSLARFNPSNGQIRGNKTGLTDTKSTASDKAFQFANIDKIDEKITSIELVTKTEDLSSSHWKTDCSADVLTFAYSSEACLADETNAANFTNKITLRPSDGGKIVIDTSEISFKYFKLFNTNTFTIGNVTDCYIVINYNGGATKSIIK